MRRGVLTSHCACLVKHKVIKLQPPQDSDCSILTTDELCLRTSLSTSCTAAQTPLRACQVQLARRPAKGHTSSGH